MIDYIVISYDKSSVSVINKNKTSFLFKGSDYKNSNLDITGKIELEKKAVIKNGGKIIIYTWTGF